ncbi:MAG TPA: UDP-N-acetylglucosamine 1-carboxyvinyltransferase [bacterium]|nr:UDP-N-acetylglucosamine 1-carboxyvinyltransferase [bacterium]
MRLRIEGGIKLKGEVDIIGAKNSALPIMAATLLTSGENIIYNVPDLKDVHTMMNMLENFGAKLRFEDNTLYITIDEIQEVNPPEDQVKQMRASFLVAGPLLARLGKIKIPLPGGCQIGSRPVDLHLKGFQALGARVSSEHGYVELEGKNLKGTSIYLDIPTVTGTENIIMAAVLAKGKTEIINPAKEPEVVDLADVLNKMGAKIKGAGSDRIEIEGVNSLSPFNHTVIPDRIEAGTFLVAGAITGGEVTIRNVRKDHLGAVIGKLEEMGHRIETDEDKIRIIAKNTGKACDITTAPYPGFPTDMQALFASLLGVTKGTSIITETIFDRRFGFVDELIRMGANMKVQGNTLIIVGVKRYSGASVTAGDLRAGAALVMAGLNAEGITEIAGVEHIERGYESIDRKLRSLGAEISLEP